jgi:hypothetical protein
MAIKDKFHGRTQRLRATFKSARIRNRPIFGRRQVYPIFVSDAAGIDNYSGHLQIQQFWHFPRPCAAPKRDSLGRAFSGRQLHFDVHLLVESGIHIIEPLNLEEISRRKVYEFAFVAAPLKIRGATGSPIRPLALA